MTTEVQFYVVAPLVAVAVQWWRGWPLLVASLVGSTRGGSALVTGRGAIAASLLPGRLWTSSWPVPSSASWWCGAGSS